MRYRVLGCCDGAVPARCYSGRGTDAGNVYSVPTQISRYTSSNKMDLIVQDLKRQRLKYEILNWMLKRHLRFLLNRSRHRTRCSEKPVEVIPPPEGDPMNVRWPNLRLYYDSYKGVVIYEDLRR